MKATIYFLIGALCYVFFNYLGGFLSLNKVVFTRMLAMLSLM